MTTTDSPVIEAASVVFAAGKGTRMLGYGGNKTLLPLIPRGSAYEGEQPLLFEVLQNLPPGPVGIVVNHCAGDIEQATQQFSVTYIPQPVTNGTGGALLAARSFLETAGLPVVIITMGDVPLIRRTTYTRLLEKLTAHPLAVLAFQPEDRAQYGMLEMDGDRVLRIVEWKYWHTWPSDEQARLRWGNAGVYAAQRKVLLEYMDHLARQPHHVRKQRDGAWVAVEEYFLTDLVELMSSDGLAVGWVPTDEVEVTGVDTPEALKAVQARYRQNLAKERQ